jgi:hypothetical protein
LFYRPGSGKRISRQEDEIFTDTEGNSTAWLPCQKGDVVGVTASKAALLTTPNPTIFTIQKFPQYPIATFILELKAGGALDIEAYPLDQWENALVAESVAIVRPGFFRVRVASIMGSFPSGESTAVASGVAIHIYNDGRQSNQQGTA